MEHLLLPLRAGEVAPQVAVTRAYGPYSESTVEARCTLKHGDAVVGIWDRMRC